ncbi:trigger factor [Acetitomaculum ruminis DSM 5522]|uniref:Trigger factor n=1 Tax=Acetitomaculum ruminis DSM 5522 TaxID=1120918 RepID=A0A1I0XC72_9FIRM|nr:trigger factor [Acetitomaculum ruminis]SFA98625.1 trigger factor [Acetitomaculum ruminis DSM 5522]
MSVNVENLENSMAKLTIEVAAADFDKAVQEVYMKQRGRISIPGFRKGKAPRKVIENMYGSGVFYEDAANRLIQTEYPKAASESKLEIVSQPEIDVVQVESGKNFIFTATVALKPEITLGDYKGIAVEVESSLVTDEEVNIALDRERENNSRTVTVEDRPVKDGDTANIDYEGSVDGVPFEGGAAKGYDLLIGSHTFIDTFEDQIIGMNIGDEKDVNVTFPEEYHSESLKGKPAVFKVKVNGIKEKQLPELDDEFAKDVSEFDTLDEYKADIKKNLEEVKIKDIKTAKENAVIDKIIENSTIELPQPMVDTQTGYLIDDFGQRLSRQGMSLEQYMQFTGSDMAKMREQMEPQAIKRIQTRLVLEAVVKAEGIEATEEEVDKEIESMAKNYGMEADKLKEVMSDTEKEQMKLDVAVAKAIDFVRDAAVETEAVKKEEE